MEEEYKIMPVEEAETVIFDSAIELGVFCKPKLAKVAKHFWRMLHLQNGESCNGLISLV